MLMLVSVSLQSRSSVFPLCQIYDLKAVSLFTSPSLLALLPLQLLLQQCFKISPP